MKKKTINVRSLVDKYQENCARISEIADLCEQEQRERNEAEDAEFKALTRENQYLEMKFRAANMGARETTKGIYRPMLENGMLCGVPVFTTEAITDQYIGLGDWTYQPSGFFGEPTMTVDPYTTALDNSIRFVYNTRFATKTIRKEAFKLVKIGA